MQVLYFKTLAGKTAAFHPISGSAVPVHGHHHWLAIAGSAGQPRDANPSAAYAPGPAEPGRTWWRSIASTVTANAQCSVHVVRLPGRSPADERGDGSER